MQKYNLFDNAIDSLEMGIDFYLNEKLKNAHKHAILNVFHSIELLLKEKLLKINQVFIYQEANVRLVTSKSKTIGFSDILPRYKKLEIELSSEHRQIISELQLKRNHIIHFEFIPDKEKDFIILGKSLKFIKEFLEEHLDLRLKDVISAELYTQIEEIVFPFEERYLKAMEEAKERTRGICKDDLIDPKEAIECPDCGTETLVCGDSEDGDGECTLCEEHFTVTRCSSCGLYMLGDETTTCSECWYNRYGDD